MSDGVVFSFSCVLMQVHFDIHDSIIGYGHHQLPVYNTETECSKLAVIKSYGDKHLQCCTSFV